MRTSISSNILKHGPIFRKLTKHLHHTFEIHFRNFDISIGRRKKKNQKSEPKKKFEENFDKKNC